MHAFLEFTHLLIVIRIRASVKRKIIFLCTNIVQTSFFCFWISLVSIAEVCFHLYVWNSTTGRKIWHIEFFVYILVRTYFLELSSTKDGTLPHLEKSWKYDEWRNIYDKLNFNTLRNVVQSLSWVFDISTRWRLKLRGKWREKYVKDLCKLRAEMYPNTIPFMISFR